MSLKRHAGKFQCSKVFFERNGFSDDRVFHGCVDQDLCVNVYNHSNTFIFALEKLTSGSESQIIFLEIKFFYTQQLIFCSNNNNIYLLQLGCYPVAVVILHVNKT